MKSSEKQSLQYGKIFLEKGEEKIELGYAEIKASRIKYNKNFSMLWAENWKQTGETTLDLFLWLIANARKGWVHRITDEELANELGVTRKTIAKAKHRLHEAGILKYEAKAIFLNPAIVYRGTAGSRGEAITEYEKYKGIGDNDEEGSAAGRKSALGTAALAEKFSEKIPP